MRARASNLRSGQHSETVFDASRAASAFGMLKRPFQMQSHRCVRLSGLKRAGTAFCVTDRRGITVGKAGDAGTEKQGGGNREYS
jgi:hypothetical protein